MEFNKLLSFSLYLLLITSVVESFDYNEKELQTEEGLEAMYDRWRDHHKVTEKSPERFNAFKATAQLVHNHNKLNKPYKLEINSFADMTYDDTHKFELPGPACPNPLSTTDSSSSEPPKRIDWREKNVVTPVKLATPVNLAEKQGGCIHLFQAVGAIEGINAITTGKLITLSEQQFIDCSDDLTLAGVYKYYQENGAATIETYPYVGDKGTCDKSKFGPRVTIEGWKFAGRPCEGNGETIVARAVARQPTTFCMETGPELASYKEGIFSGPCGTVPSCMLLVGYDETPDGKKYWIAKNNLGENWGEKGYIRLERGVDVNKGVCGMYGFCTCPTKSIETRNIEL